MKFFRLYMKELKFLAGMGLILFLIHFGLYIENFIFQLRVYVEEFVPCRNTISDYISEGEPFYYCFMLVFSFFMENKSKTSYQLVALPINRFYIIGSKFLAVLSIGFM